VTVTIPTNASQNFSTGTKVELIQVGVGRVSVVPAGGVTLSGLGTIIHAQFGQVTLLKAATNSWLIYGDVVSDQGVVVKTSEPVAADYGLAAIPLDAVWVQKP
jgi:pheromone shutdown protein TraB